MGIQEYRRGLMVHPCGPPVLRISVEEVNQLHRVQSQGRELCGERRGHYGIEGRAVVDEQHPHICVLFVQMGEDTVQCHGDCVVHGSVEAVGKLERSEVMCRRGRR